MQFMLFGIEEEDLWDHKQVEQAVDWEPHITRYLDGVIFINELISRIKSKYFTVDWNQELYTIPQTLCSYAVLHESSDESSSLLIRGI
jgi:hypothetical protein